MNQCELWRPSDYIFILYQVTPDTLAPSHPQPSYPKSRNSTPLSTKNLRFGPYGIFIKFIKIYQNLNWGTSPYCLTWFRYPGGLEPPCWEQILIWHDRIIINLPSGHKYYVVCPPDVWAHNKLLQWTYWGLSKCLESINRHLQLSNQCVLSHKHKYTYQDQKSGTKEK